MKKHPIYTYLFIGILIVGFFWLVLIRPFLLRNNISAFFIADCMPNFLAVIILTFGTMTLPKNQNSKGIFKKTVTFTGSMITYEFMQLIIPGRVFDYKDIIASVLGGIFTYLILTLTNRIIIKRPLKTLSWPLIK